MSKRKVKMTFTLMKMMKMTKVIGAMTTQMKSQVMKMMVMRTMVMTMRTMGKFLFYNFLYLSHFLHFDRVFNIRISMLKTLFLIA